MPEPKKLMLQLEDGSEVDLRSVIGEASTEQLIAMGFPIKDGKFSLKALPSEFKTEAEVKMEKLAVAANFIKHQVLPEKYHGHYGVKQINTDAGSFGAAVPTELADAIHEKKGKYNAFRNRAFSFQLAGKFDLPVEGDGVTGYWVGEVDDADANLVTDSEPTLGKKSLDDHYVAALVKVSWKLLNTAAPNIVNFVASLAGRKLAETEEAAFVGGNGTGKPRGIRQETVESVAQAGAELSYQDLVNLYFALPAQYRQNAVFVTSNLGARLINGLKDDQNRPIFQPGQPLDEIFRKPLIESTDIPENLGAGGDATEIWFGDPAEYWIKDGEAMQMATQDIIERLQTKVLVYAAVDGKCVNTDAFAKLSGVDTAAES